MKLLLGFSAAGKVMCSRVGLVRTAGLAIGALAIAVNQGQAAPYASGVSISGTTVNFILNEPADALSYSINGGAPQVLNGATIGAKSFSLASPTDTFSIIASKNDPVGYTIPTGEEVFNVDTTEPILLPGSHGLAVPSPGAGFRLISDEDNLLTRFNSPRGVDVSNDPNAPNFGTAYIANSAAGTQAASSRVLGDGMYALRADGSDAFGYGDTAQNPTVEGFPAWISTSSNSPYRVTVGEDGQVYVADWSDANGSLIRVTPDLLTGTNVLAGFGGTAPLPAGQNHGSIPAVWVEGSSTAGNLTVYTIDEDLTTAHVTGSGSTTDQNSLWRYDIGSGTLPHSAMPTFVNGAAIGIANTDVSRGADGKWYISQSRFDVDNSPTLYVVSADGSTVLFNSLLKTRELQNDPAATSDILQYVVASDVSPDQKWLALMLNGSDVAVLPLDDDGLPLLDQRMVVKTTVDFEQEFSGRDIAFDAANNIHYVSSGQGRYRVLAPGGETVATTSFDGTDFDFTITSGGGPGEEDADFDGDGDVDGADFLTWQRGVGTPGDQPDGDANGDNLIDGADLDVWQLQFGQGAAAPVAGAVPEPGTFGLAVLAGLACLLAALPRRRLALARARK
jgi:hypothetical protein